METIKNNIPPQAQIFFRQLTNYLDTKLYFFGSVQRDDYFPQGSDIDTDIFTDNEQSTIIKLQHFLDVPRSDFKNFVWRLNSNNRVVRGHKIMYKDPNGEFAVEFSIYNEKIKDDILYEHNAKTCLPYYATILLIVLKYLFYTLGIIPSEWYIYWKKKILSVMIGKPEDQFVVLDVKEKKKEEEDTPTPTKN